MTDALALAARAHIPRRDGPLDSDYRALVDVFPLVSIRDGTHLEYATALIDQLLEKGPLSSGENAYLSALTDLVETYEDAHVPIREVRGMELVRYLMEEGDLSERDVAPLFGGPSSLAEVLSGKSPISWSQSLRLADHFRLPAHLFLDQAPKIEDDPPVSQRYSRP
ncbi:MAG TPA: hypothetical protein VN837_06470 [Chloroflexota bacterium]|nr:hypothetical protein [Chloroflexota bacterium]